VRLRLACIWHKNSSRARCGNQASEPGPCRAAELPSQGAPAFREVKSQYTCVSRWHVLCIIDCILMAA
jgi:hypothetical protein